MFPSLEKTPLVASLLLALAAQAGCSDDSVSGAGSDSGADSDSDSDGDTDSDTDTEPELCRLEQATALCAAATTQAACASSSMQLPSGQECGYVSDVTMECHWVPVVETEQEPDGGCAFGEQRALCAYVTCGESLCSGIPCGQDIMNMDQAFYEDEGGTVLTGWASGIIHHPSITVCDAVAPSPELCGCICDPTYPLQ